MEKRGMSNIEMVLAFIIFIGVVLFAVYFFINHFNQSTKENSLDYVYGKVVSNLNEEVQSYSIKVNRSAFPSNQEILAVNLSREITISENVVAYDLNGVNVEINLVDNIIYLDISNVGDLITIEISE